MLLHRWSIIFHKIRIWLGTYNLIYDQVCHFFDNASDFFTKSQEMILGRLWDVKSKQKKKEKKRDKLKNWLLIKIQQFLSNLDQTFTNWLAHLWKLLAKFHQNWTKIVDFSLIANFEASLIFYESVFTYTQRIDSLLMKMLISWQAFGKLSSCAK